MTPEERLDKLRSELGPLFLLCQWAHAVAGRPLTFAGEVAAAEQALISFLHETPAAKAVAECRAAPQGEPKPVMVDVRRVAAFLEAKAANYRESRKAATLASDVANFSYGEGALDVAAAQLLNGSWEKYL